MAKSRPVHFPDADFATVRLKRSQLDSGPWIRIHPASKSAIYFSRHSNGRFTPENSPFGVMYAAKDIVTALFEVFGDEMFENDRRIRAFRWTSYSASRLRFPGVKICNLANQRVRASLKVELGTLMAQDFDAPRAWALAIMTHPSEPHGIVYRSRFTVRNCVGLFDREGTGALVEEELIGPLVSLPEANEFLDKYRCIIV